MKLEGFWICRVLFYKCLYVTIKSLLFIPKIQIRLKLVSGGGEDVRSYGSLCTHVIVDKCVYVCTTVTIFICLYLSFIIFSWISLIYYAKCVFLYLMKYASNTQEDPTCVAARRDGKIIVTALWVDHSYDIGLPVDHKTVCVNYPT